MVSADARAPADLKFLPRFLQRFRVAVPSCVLADVVRAAAVAAAILFGSTTATAEPPLPALTETAV
ncbi:MAG: hypothetical protein ACRENE_15255, partial [Polyangiaceae bacterium]